MTMSFTRRQVLVSGSALAASVLAGGIAGAAHAFPTDSAGRRTIYRLSSRGRRASRGVKVHNANMRFKTKRAADRQRAHPGDRSRIVPLTVSVEEFHRLFGRGGHAADLRKLDRDR